LSTSFLMKPRVHVLTFAFAMFAGGLASSCMAQDTSSAPSGVRIGLTYKPGVKPGVLVLPVAGEAGDSLRTMLQRDLDNGDRLQVITGDPTAGSAAINYCLLDQLGANVVLRATLDRSSARVEVHDVTAKRLAETRVYSLPQPALSPAWRMGVHGIADDIEQMMFGTRGVNQTRIAFVRNGRIYVVDSDGANATPITPAGPLSVSPAWHPSGRYLAYSVMGVQSRIMVRDLTTGADRPLIATPGGLNITPTWSPDGNSIAYAHGEDAGTEIFSANAFDDSPGRQLTVGRGSENVTPSFSPDGRRIVFTSGRSGRPDVYIADADGTNLGLLTPEVLGDQGYRSDPDWSADGRWIAYQSQISGNFQLMLVSLRDRSVKQLTSEGSNEDPSFAPDSRHIVFASTRSGTKELWIMDVESGRVRQLTRLGGAKLAAWSRPLGVR
jgi:TolB protein